MRTPINYRTEGINSFQESEGQQLLSSQVRMLNPRFVQHLPMPDTTEAIEEEFSRCWKIYSSSRGMIQASKDPPMGLEK